MPRSTGRERAARNEVREARMTIRVVNKANHKPTPNDVYIGRGWGRGRGSIWGNPFKTGKDGTRAEVIAKYEQYIQERPDLLARLPQLRGKNLVCFCAPLPCHGDVLKRLCEALP
jgi:hypothetical protein